MGNAERGPGGNIARGGAGEKGNESARGSHPPAPDFLVSPFSFRFPVFFLCVCVFFFSPFPH